VLNRSEKGDIAAAIRNVEGRLAAQCDVWELSHPDLKVTHAFKVDRKVRPTTRTLQGAVRDNKLTYTFPGHSLTILKLRLE
jgi:alpha-L-arabinofuranosidase